MIITVTYYSDSPAKPEVRFYPDTAHQTANVGKDIAADVGTGKDYLVYEVASLKAEPIMIYPTDERPAF